MSVDVGAIAILVLLVLISPLLIVAIAWWLRLFLATWIALALRLLGKGDKSKDFLGEVLDMADAKTDYGKMKREFNERATRVQKSIDERRSKSL